MLIALGAMATIGTLDIFLTSFENATFPDSTQQDIEQMQLERFERST
jgi:hypothetical protein